MNTIFNGRNFVTGEFLNAHFSYKGRSVIIDYEWTLHAYTNKENEKVLVEMYPYKDDITTFYVDLDSRFNKAKMEDIIPKLDELLKEENK